MNQSEFLLALYPVIRSSFRKAVSKLIAKLKNEMHKWYNKRHGLSTQTIDEELDEDIRSPIEDDGSQNLQSNVGSVGTEPQVTKFKFLSGRRAQP